MSHRINYRLQLELRLFFAGREGRASVCADERWRIHQLRRGSDGHHPKGGEAHRASDWDPAGQRRVVERYVGPHSRVQLRASPFSLSLINQFASCLTALTTFTRTNLYRGFDFILSTHAQSCATKRAGTMRTTMTTSLSKIRPRRARTIASRRCYSTWINPPRAERRSSRGRCLA